MTSPAAASASSADSLSPLTKSRAGMRPQRSTPPKGNTRRALSRRSEVSSDATSAGRAGAAGVARGGSTLGKTQAAVGERDVEPLPDAVEPPVFARGGGVAGGRRGARGKRCEPQQDAAKASNRAHSGHDAQKEAKA